MVILRVRAFTDATIRPQTRRLEREGGRNEQLTSTNQQGGFLPVLNAGRRTLRLNPKGQ